MSTIDVPAVDPPAPAYSDAVSLQDYAAAQEIMAPIPSKGGDQSSVYSKRMSGLPMLEPLLGKDKYPVLDEGVRLKLNELLDLFPEPSVEPPVQPPTAAHTGKVGAGSGWGSIRGFAEKFNAFVR
jgi:hypothetical protein